MPGSSRDGIVGWLGDALKIRVSAPAERGKANAAVEAILARALGIPGEYARIVGGLSSAHKIVEIQGLTAAQIHERLAQP